ncbi:MAG: Glycosyltransferase, group 1 family [Parcubacteria group bacterium GW2011_GWB1_44_7]|nr:MAG: Glycosyltransferase, group 1 family [Parcubacteria group bacterium GW2011_GWB1_44_7]
MTGKKKILYVITKSNWGGAQRQVFDLATNLPEDKFETAVALGGGGLLKEKLDGAGIRTIAVETLGRDIKIFNDLISFFKIFQIIKKEKPDILHLHSSKVGFLGALIGRLLGIKKIIYTVHGWMFLEKQPQWWTITMRFFSWLTILLTHKTIAVSENDKNASADFIGVKNKITVIPNGINTINFLEKSEARKKILPNQKTLDGEFWFGTIAELHKNKGLNFAIEALDKNLPAVLVIVGEGEERKNLERLILERELQEKVFLVGQIDNTATLLKAFDVFLLPSTKEGMPYSILEAGAAGRPVIASNVGGLPEIITDMESGILVRAGRPAEIRKAMEFLINNPERRAAFGAALQNVITEKFGLSKMLSQIETLYNSL